MGTGSLRRQTIVGIFSLVPLVAGSPPARSDEDVAVEPNRTWGTAPAEDRAGRVLDVVEAAGVVYLAGEFPARSGPISPTATGVLKQPDDRVRGR